MQIQTLKTQMEEKQKMHERAMKALECDGSSKIDVNKQLYEIRENHENQIKQLEHELLGTRTRYKDEISMLTEKINGLETEKKQRDDVYCTDFDSIRDNLKVLEDENSK